MLRLHFAVCTCSVTIRKSTFSVLGLFTLSGIITLTIVFLGYVIGVYVHSNFLACEADG